MLLPPGMSFLLSNGDNLMFSANPRTCEQKRQLADSQEGLCLGPCGPAALHTGEGTERGVNRLQGWAGRREDFSF